MTPRSSQVWQRDAEMNESARRLAAARTNQDLNFQEGARKLAAEKSEIIDDDHSKCPNNLHISRAYVPHLKKVHSNLRQQLNRKQEDKMEYLDVNTLIWVLFFVCHAGCSSSSWKELFGEFTFYQKSSTTNSETIVRYDKDVDHGSNRCSEAYPVIDWQQSSSKRTTLSTDRAAQLSTAKNLRILRLSVVHGQNQWLLQIQSNGVRLKFVSHTSNLLEQTCDCQKRTMFLQKLISNLQDLPRSQSLETVPVCIV